MQEFEALVKRTHDHQLKVIIDFVPNHVARKYHSDVKPTNIKDLGEADDVSFSFRPDNNFYYLPGEPFKIPEGYDPLDKLHDFQPEDHLFVEIPAKVSGNNVFKAQPDISDWFETVKLNYGIDFSNGEVKHFQPIPDTWNKMRDILLFWASKNIDGFRCDMAEMVPVEFWQWAIPQVKARKHDILFIAEIYNPEQYRNYLFAGKFDYLYDKVQLYDTLKHIIQKKGEASNITEVWRSLKGINHKMLRFLENHDEQRIASPYFAGDPFRGIPAMGVTSFLYNGPLMIYFGQEEGEPGAGIAGFSGEDGRTTIYDYWGVPSHQKWMNEGKFDGEKLSENELKLRKTYHDILNISKFHPVINEGDFFDLYNYNSSLGKEVNDDVYYFLRFTDANSLLIIVNFSDIETFDLSITLPVVIENHRFFSQGKKITATDLMDKSVKPEILMGEDHGLIKLNLNPLACHVIEF